MKSLKDHMPYFITGSSTLPGRGVVDEVVFWTPKLATTELAKVPERYHLKVGHAMSNSMGLEIFIQMVNYLKETQRANPLDNIQSTILAAQKQVMYYHNTQYANDKKNDSYYSGLLNQSTADEGKKKNVLSAGQRTPKEV